MSEKNVRGSARMIRRCDLTFSFAIMMFGWLAIIVFILVPVISEHKETGNAVLVGLVFSQVLTLCATWGVMVACAKFAAISGFEYHKQPPSSDDSAASSSQSPSPSPR